MFGMFPSDLIRPTTLSLRSVPWSRAVKEKREREQARSSLVTRPFQSSQPLSHPHTLPLSSTPGHLPRPTHTANEKESHSSAQSSKCPLVEINADTMQNPHNQEQLEPASKKKNRTNKKVPVRKQAIKQEKEEEEKTQEEPETYESRMKKRKLMTLEEAETAPDIDVMDPTVIDKTVQAIVNEDADPYEMLKIPRPAASMPPDVLQDMSINLSISLGVAFMGGESYSEKKLFGRDWVLESEEEVIEKLESVLDIVRKGFKKAIGTIRSVPKV